MYRHIIKTSQNQKFSQILQIIDSMYRWCRMKNKKIHELLHIYQDILQHGPPSGFDICSTETYHHLFKSMSQNTQMIKTRFEVQTTNRFYEDNILHTTYNDTLSIFSLINKPKQINKNSNLSQI